MDDGGHLRRWKRATHVTSHATDKRTGQIRNKHLAWNLIPKACIANVLHHTDNLHIRFRARVITISKMPPQWISIAKVVAGQALIHDHHSGNLKGCGTD